MGPFDAARRRDACTSFTPLENIVMALQGEDRPCLVLFTDVPSSGSVSLGVKNKGQAVVVAFPFCCYLSSRVM